ncbi:MAG: hypothetical protein IPL63_10435 [Saprospiraceae bacterium]|nr:hypothetical protein [Saprospiraceae bacterium]
MSKSKVATALKSYKYLTPTLVVFGVLSYSLMGWFFVENYFKIQQPLLLIFFGAACLIVNLYVLSKIVEVDEDWSGAFTLSFIGLAILYGSMALSGEVQKYFFIALSILAIVIAFLASEEFNIEGILKFISILITFCYLVTSFNSFGKLHLEQWLSFINSIVSIRLIISLLVIVIVFGEGLIIAFGEDKPDIPLIPYIHYTPNQTTNPLVGIIEGFKKVGVWIRNNAVFFINIIWTILAYILYYILRTLGNVKNRILSFLEHSDRVISVSLMMFTSILFIDYTIRLSKTEMHYLLTADYNSLIGTIWLFAVVVLLSVLLKIAAEFEYRKINEKYVSLFIKNTFSGMVQAPITVAAYYCAAGWLLVGVSYILSKIGSPDLLSHFHHIGIYTIFATVIIVIVAIVVSFILPKTNEG